MAMKKVAPIKEISLTVKSSKALARASGRGRTPLDKLQDQLAQRFAELGCPACLSGLNRIIIEDQLARRVR